MALFFRWLAPAGNAFLHYHIFRSAINLRTMTTLTVTKRGQVTFRKDVLRHLGIQPGGKIRLDLLPDGRAELKAERPQSSFRELQGFLSGKGNARRLSIEEITEAIAAGGAAAGIGRE
jgi:bifunctional DNA-binding transcriptional regulator/antitoxin component of YhaV-PrlF toxin-antitoxin module